MSGDSQYTLCFLNIVDIHFVVFSMDQSDQYTIKYGID